MITSMHSVVWERDRIRCNDAYNRLRNEFGEHWLGYTNDRMPVHEIFKGHVTPLKKRERERLLRRYH
jgi:hypothetical protein